MNNNLKSAAVIALGAATIGFGAFFNFKDAGAEDLFRLEGANRYETSTRISKEAHPVTANAVVLISGETYADALAAAPLAKIANGPVLLTKKNQTPNTTVHEIFRVLPKGKTIYVLGGTAAINQGQINWLQSQGYKINRLAGANRMDTSAKVAITADSLRGTNPTHVYLVSGYSFADGLAVGPLAAKESKNILVTEAGDLSQTVRDYFNGNIDTISKVTLVGGTSVLPDSIKQLFEEHGWVVERIAGANRYETAIAIAKKVNNKSNPHGFIGLAAGNNYPDGLAAGYYLSMNEAPLLLEQNKDCSVTHRYMISEKDYFNGGYVFGGTAAVSRLAEIAAEQAISGQKQCQ